MDRVSGSESMIATDCTARPHVVDAIFREHYGWLNRWLSRRTPADCLAEDVAAETMLRMVRVSAGEAIREPRAMMTTIARRLLIDLRARSDVESAYASTIANLPASLEPSAEDRLLIQEALLRVDAILKTLPIKARSAFLLSQIDGLRHAEIAMTLGVSVSMVRKYIAAGFKACYREYLTHE